jgi:ABC-type branched-subunit amino acid transport system substrate-binding protein
MMKGKWVTSLLCLSFFLLVFSAPRHCAGAEAPKPVEVTVGVLADMTGPYAPMWPPFEESFKLVDKWLNASHFLPGVKIKWMILDHGHEAGKIISVYKQIRDAKAAIIISNSSIDGSALKKMVSDDRIPMVCQGSTQTLVDPPGWVFCLPPLYSDQAGAFMDWILSSAQKDKKPQLAILTWDTAAGRGAITPEVRKYAKMKGVDIVAEEFIPRAPLEATNELMRIKNAGAEYTFGVLHASPLSVVLKDAQRLGMIGKIKFATSYAINMYELIKYAGPLSEGFLSPQWFAAAPEKVPPAIYKTLGMDLPKDPLLIQGAGLIWTEMMVSFRAMKDILDKKGAKGITGPDMFEALKQIKNEECLGWSTPLSFGENDRVGADWMIVNEIYKGGVRIIGDRIKVPDVKRATAGK